MKIMTVIGARPQFIKSAIVSRALKKYPHISEVIVHTGQHYDPAMSDIFFKQLKIPNPKYKLNVGSGSHAMQTAEIMKALEPIMQNEQPKKILIYGDTNSTLAAVLVASKLQIPIAHVEAGLRSFNKNIPEEVNRIIADQLSELLFVPYEKARTNLVNEGIAEEKIKIVGDVMFDSALMHLDQKRASRILNKLHVNSKGFVLLTIHRQENTDCETRLRKIISEIDKISKIDPIVFPIHPRTAKAMMRYNLAFASCQNIHIIDPLSYLDMLAIENESKIIITDSGGVQKEAFFYNVPCLVVRDQTEWDELVSLNASKLVSPEDISIAVGQASKEAKAKNSAAIFGDADAASKIAYCLAEI